MPFKPKVVGSIPTRPILRKLRRIKALRRDRIVALQARCVPGDERSTITRVFRSALHPAPASRLNLSRPCSSTPRPLSVVSRSLPETSERSRPRTRVRCRHHFWSSCRWRLAVQAEAEGRRCRAGRSNDRSGDVIGHVPTHDMPRSTRRRQALAAAMAGRESIFAGGNGPGSRSRRFAHRPLAGLARP